MTERIEQNMKVEISDVLHPYKLWVATVRTIAKFINFIYMLHKFFYCG